MIKILGVSALALCALAQKYGDDEIIAPRQHAPAIIHERHGQQVTSTNWSGYAVTGTNVTDVKGSWIVPSVNCSGASTNQYSSLWVGIDGYSSNTVEQTGTDSDCQNGTPTYYAWFEFYPHPSFSVNNFPVAAGDHISAEVSYADGKFTVTLTNITSHNNTFSTSTKVASAKRSSAEWIMEAPYSGGILPLADFGVAYLGSQFTSGFGNLTTLGGTTGAIGNFGSSWDAITMDDSSGAIKAVPSPLSNTDNASFSVAWKAGQ